MAVLWLSVNVYALLVGWGGGGESFFASPSRMGLAILWWVGGLLSVLLTGSVSKPSGAADSPIFGRLKGASKNRRERQKCKAHGAQEPEHIFEYVRIPSTAQRSSFDAQQVFRGALKIAVFGASWAAFLVVLSRTDRQNQFILAETGEAIRALGLIVFLVGGTVRLLAIRTREASEKSNQLAVTGVYRHIRHPEYLGILLLLFGLSLVFRSAIGLCVLLVWTGVVVVRIAREETRLANADPDYVAYKMRTDRLLPSVY
jgi:protein-S-isoprenylcysteine O-methyltransferase Ste14